MYRIGHKKRNTGHKLYVLFGLFILILSAVATAFWYLSVHSSKTTIEQTKPSTQEFDPNNTTGNLKIDTPLYTMELPANWKQISENKDTRYNSIEWQMQSGMKNRWIEVFTDRTPTDRAFNKIIPITVTNNRISAETVSDNCAKFTPLTGANLKVQSKWQDASFLCDMSNKTDNIIGVSDKTVGTSFSLSGPLKGIHTYFFIYTDRGIPEDQNPIVTALTTFTTK